MKWLQRVLPNGWPYVRSGGALIVAIGLYFMPEPIARVGLAFITVSYAFVCLHNYDVLSRK
jgi:hypothetical protein